MAERDWRCLGARTQSEARAFYIATLRRQLGVHVVREMARHRLHRLPWIGVPRSVVTRRGARGTLGTGGTRPQVDGVPQPADFYAHQQWVRVADSSGLGAAAASFDADLDDEDK